jgi:acetoin utilization deacetylase AcuC-like enzyme
MGESASGRKLPFRLIYHDDYDLNLGLHVFPAQKYRMLRDRLLASGFATTADFQEPDLPPEEDLLAVHEPAWIRRLLAGTLTFDDIRRLELPYSRQMVRAFLLAAAGTTLAARNALEEGIGFNIGGGFHHAFAGHGEGFCAIHDVAVGIRRLQREGLVKKVLVVDCDVHHGNGTAALFARDPAVFTISIHQYNNYPAEKPPSTVDIHLPDGADDSEYLLRLADPLEAAVIAFRPDLMMYIAGADPYCEDQLGGLSLTLDGLLARDRLVFECALSRRVPVAVTLAGGYAMRLADTVTIHFHTAVAAGECLDDIGWRGAVSAPASLRAAADS